MARTTHIQLDTSKLDKMIRENPERVNAILSKLAHDTAGDVVDSFNSVSPAPAGEPPGIDTGNLKGSIKTKPEGRDWVVSDGVPYGVMLEYGTSRMAARPFMGPAVLRTVQRAPAGLLKVIED